MAAMAGILALSTLVPEPDLAPGRLAELRRTRPFAAFVVERLRPSELSRSPLFVGLAGWVFASTAWSIVNRVRIERRRRRGREGTALERFRASRAVLGGAEPDAAIAGARAELRRRGYRLEPGGAEEVVASRGTAGFAGSILFHVGILVTMVGVAVSARTRVNGEVMLVECFPVALGPGTVVAATSQTALYPLMGTNLSMRDFTAEYARGFQPTDFAAILEASRNGGAPVATVARVNQGVTVEGFQLTLHRYGFAPEVTVTGPGGRTLAAGTAILTVIPPGTEDGLALEDGSELRIALFPDAIDRGGAFATRSMAPIAPVLSVRHLAGGAEVARGRVALGETASVGAIRISFHGLRYWADLVLGRDGGLWWIAAGSALIAAGLGLRFLLDPQTIRIAASRTPAGTRLDLLVTARWFPALNEERANDLAARLARRLGAAPGEAA
jgi:hypothetical protein